MSRVTELGYVGLSVSSLDAWRDYAAGIVGLEYVDEGEGDRAYLRMDKWHHRITLHADGGDDLAYLGWRVPGPVELEQMAEKLRLANIPVEEASEEECYERRVMGLLKLMDPGGNPTEIFYGPQVDNSRPFHPGRPMFGRFVTGDQGMGHCVLRQTDVAAATRFYQLLGMSGSVEYVIPGPKGRKIKPVFMHVNGRQHSVAFGVGSMAKRINHLMIEYADLDDLGLAHDSVRARKIPVAMQLGKHANDEALTFYCQNPSGWLWEIGWGGREAPKQQEYYTRDIFGHGPENTDLGIDLKLN